MAVATIARFPIAIPQSAPTSFYDKNFKCIRVFADFIGRLCLALIYKIISFVCWVVCSARLSHQYHTLAQYHTKRALGDSGAYMKFGKELIDFSINSSTRVKEPLPAGGDEYTALKEMYGDAAIDRLSFLGTKQIPLRKEHLVRKEMVAKEDGCCFGMGLDFISHYLQRIRKSTPSLEAVKSTASRYVEGAPEEAQLAQIFYEALDISRLLKAGELQNKQKRDVKLKEIKKWLEEENEKTAKLSHLSRKAFLEHYDLLLAEADKRGQALEVEALCDELLSRQVIDIQRERMVADVFGLAIGASNTYACERMETRPHNEFEKLVRDLPNGTHQVAFRTKGHAHAIVFVKTAEQCFLYDSNCGTVRMEPAQAAARIWNKVRDLHWPSGVTSISFSQCTLKN